VAGCKGGAYKTRPKASSKILFAEYAQKVQSMDSVIILFLIVSFL
jgi:hypothetical protein